MQVVNLNVNVPINLGAIKLHQYQKYLKILRGVEKDSKENDNISKENNDFLNQKALEIFCGLTLKESYGLPVSVFDSVLKQLAICFEENTPRVDRFKMTDPTGKEIEFGLIPNLSKISFGEYVDAESYVVDWDNMHKAMAVFYRPITFSKNGTYLIEDYEGTDRWADVMKDMPLSVAMGAVVFFYRLGNKLSKITMNSLLSQLVTQDPDSTLAPLLERNGDGTSLYMALQEEMYQGLMRLPKFHYTNV